MAKIFGLVMALLMAANAALALEVQQVTSNAYAIIGPLGQRSTQNLGNNASFGFVVTAEGVVLIDAGGTWRGAAEIDAAIKTVTNLPVTHVINTGGQDHRWLANGYWQAKGAVVIASRRAVQDQKARGSAQLSGLAVLVGMGLKGTEPAYADIEFETEYKTDIGGEQFEIYHAGQAHTPGDSFVWMPKTKVVFAGDIVYVDRMLGIGEQSHSGHWISAFETMAALQPQHVIPGHGPATDLPHARRDTYDYLVNLRNQMAAYIETGGDIIGSVDVAQSDWEYLSLYSQLARRNAQQVFIEMEWE